jgi:hypothetical protein
MLPLADDHTRWFVKKGPTPGVRPRPLLRSSSNAFTGGLICPRDQAAFEAADATLVYLIILLLFLPFLFLTLNNQIAVSDLHLDFPFLATWQ